MPPRPWLGALPEWGWYPSPRDTPAAPLRGRLGGVLDVQLVLVDDPDALVQHDREENQGEGMGTEEDGVRDDACG